jgi:hypothetical protein
MSDDSLKALGNICIFETFSSQCALLIRTKTWEEKMKLRQTEASDDTEPRFENPPDDSVPLKIRDMFSRVMLYQADGSFPPFRMG